VSGDIERVFAGLTEAKVRYLVVGGVAVVLHGHLRATADLDLVIALEPPNVLRAIQALTRLGLRPRAPVATEAFADPLQRQAWVREKNMMVFSLWDPGSPGFEVDLFVEEPFDFDDTYARSVRVCLDHTECRVISVADLITLKRRAGRPRDVEDIAALEALMETPDER